MTTAAYLRVSTGQQSIDQQHDAIAAAGITPDRVFTDTASGRAGSNRPGWTECMGYLREGDHLVVVAVDRLGRSVREVATALHELTSRRVHRGRLSIGALVASGAVLFGMPASIFLAAKLPTIPTRLWQLLVTAGSKHWTTSRNCWIYSAELFHVLEC
jgi:Resolvase, N terminal domain